MDDYCTGWFDSLFGADWSGCCATHDAAYATGTIGKFAADIDLAQCVAAIGGWPMALVMFAGVTAFGWYFRRKALRRR